MTIETDAISWTACLCFGNFDNVIFWHQVGPIVDWVSNMNFGLRGQV